MSVSAAIKSASTKARKGMNALDASALKELMGLYQQAAIEIEAKIASYGGGSGSIVLADLQNVLGQVYLTLQGLTQERNMLLNGQLNAAVGLGVAPLGGIEAGLSSSAQQRIATEALAFVRSFVAADGLQLSDRLWRLDRGARELLANRIEQGVIQGASASQAAAEFLGKGLSVPADIQAKMKDGNAAAIGKSAGALLTKGDGSPLLNAMRVFRTELNRAHGTAYQKGVEQVPGSVGTRFLLSPAHPKPDICDLLAVQNIHGLGPGVYPHGQSPWPAHPNTLSYVEAVFEDEVTEADKAGKETPLAALKKLPAEARAQILGLGKADLLAAGKLTQGMIRAPLYKVAARIERNDLSPELRAKTGTIRRAVAQVVSSANARAQTTRSSWGDFPDVVILDDLGAARRQPGYQAGKAGNSAAAFNVVASIIVDVRDIEKLKEYLQGAKPTIVPVRGIEAEGMASNKIAIATAEILADKLGLQVDDNIVKAATFKRTGADGWTRLALPPPFDGVIGKTKDGVLIIDDTLTQGGTLASLRGHIEAQGVSVLGAVTLTGKQYSATLAIQKRTLDALRGTYGSLETWWQQTFGYGFDRLTESEARYLLKSGASPDAIRDRITTIRKQAGFG